MRKNLLDLAKFRSEDYAQKLGKNKLGVINKMIS